MRLSSQGLGEMKGLIERQELELIHLRARVQVLEKALRWFVDEYERVQAMRQAYVHAPDCRCVLCAYDNARATLKAGDGQ